MTPTYLLRTYREKIGRRLLLDQKQERTPEEGAELERIEAWRRKHAAEIVEARRWEVTP